MTFKIDFPLTNKNIKLGNLNHELIKQAERQLGSELPPSFKSWLIKYGNGVQFNIGNCLWIEPLFGDGSVISSTEFFRNWLKDVIVFASTGVDSETYAFYTGVKDNKGEYPVIWITPGSIDGKGFVLCSTNFENFININVNFLLELNKNDLTDEDVDKLWIRLYKKYEPSIKMEASDLYRMAITAEELKIKVKLLFS
ncbi:MAG: SMI1/KNR4 family protein [Firmicutes bacterium]|nr:SMI1/KNR4 family protein [Bacillota bacterium]